MSSLHFMPTFKPRLSHLARFTLRLACFTLSHCPAFSRPPSISSLSLCRCRTFRPSAHSLVLEQEISPFLHLFVHKYFCLAAHQVHQGIGPQSRFASFSSFNEPIFLTVVSIPSPPRRPQKIAHDGDLRHLLKINSGRCSCIGVGLTSTVHPDRRPELPVLLVPRSINRKLKVGKCLGILGTHGASGSDETVARSSYRR